MHVKTEHSYVTRPYFALSGSIAKASIATSCLACFDYTNALADVVIGYMGAPLERNGRMDTSYQTLTIRNERGVNMVQTALNAQRLEIHGMASSRGQQQGSSHEILATATVCSDGIVQGMIGEETTVREQGDNNGMPLWMAEIMARIMTCVGPKGMNFARYSIDYHILRNYLYVLHVWGNERASVTLPAYARAIVNRYLENDKALADLQSKVESKLSR